MALLPTWFLDAVVAIGAVDAKGNKSFFASGFFYGIKTEERVPEGEPGKYKLFLVTNRHVASGIGETAVVRLSPFAEERSRDFPIANKTPAGWPTFVAHPDEQVDVAVTTLSTSLLQSLGSQVSFFQNDAQAATLVAMRDELQVTEGDGLFVLGFPMGLVGEPRNCAIVRAGVVSRVRDAYRGLSGNLFLVDAPVFPGSSGGPVVLRPEALAVGGTRPQLSAVLIGIVKGYLPYRESAYSRQTEEERIVFVENSGLTVVHTVDTIHDTIEHLKRKQDEWGGRSPAVSSPAPSESGPQGKE